MGDHPFFSSQEINDQNFLLKNSLTMLRRRKQKKPAAARRNERFLGWSGSLCVLYLLFDMTGSWTWEALFFILVAFIPLCFFVFRFHSYLRRHLLEMGLIWIHKVLFFWSLLITLLPLLMPLLFEFSMCWGNEWLGMCFFRKRPRYYVEVAGRAWESPKYC